MEINPEFKNGDTIYYITTDDVEKDCPYCSKTSRFKKLFHKCKHCENGKIKVNKWIVKYHFKRAFIKCITVNLQFDNILSYLLDGCNLILWEGNMFTDLDDAKKECEKRNT